MTQPGEKLLEFVTEAEFLERSRESDLRLEYSNGVLYAVAGGKKKIIVLPGIFIAVCSLEPTRGDAGFIWRAFNFGCPRILNTTFLM